MNPITALSAETLLAIPLLEPERLFTGDAQQAKQEFRALAAIWHPDRRPETGTPEVFQHLSRLYDAAAQKLRGGLWNLPGQLRVHATDGATYHIYYRKMREFELGRMFLGDRIVAYVVDKAHSDLFQNALQAIERLPCANPQMAAEIQPALPDIIRHIETEDSRVLVVRKTPDLLLLRDILDHFNGRLDARQVAWILSSLLNLACYLDYARLAHNAIGVDTGFISPPQHRSALFGGWWYAVRQRERMHAAPAATLQYAPGEVITRKCGDIRTDLELIRALGRELLGDISGARLVREKAAPLPMLDWLRLPAPPSAIDDYHTWQHRVLTASFGERRFMKLDLSADDLYSPSK